MKNKCFPCQLVTWNEAAVLSRDLAQKIKSDLSCPDLIVAIGRGGFVPARVVCDYLLFRDLTSMKIEHWGIAATKGDSAQIKFPLSLDVAGRRVLIVDDVTDTGETLQVASSYVSEKGALDVRTAVLQHKFSSHFTPDYFADLISEWRWIIYPWAAHEDLVGFSERVLTAEFVSVEAIRSALKSCYCLDVVPQLLSDALAELVDMGRVELKGDMYRKDMKHIG
jgi:hypoxanthine phosphoribosyltransferase